MATKKPPKKPALANLPVKVNSPASYALIAKHNTLVMHGQTARDEGNKIVYSFGSKDVATLELVDAEIVIEFVAPTNLDVAIQGTKTVRDLLPSFEPVSGRKDWLRYRRPATRDPRPDLDTGVGPMLGQAFRQYLGK